MKRDAGVAGGVAGLTLTLLKMLGALPLTGVYALEALIRTLTPRRFRRRDVRGHIVLITGGGSGLGRELALRFAAAGATVLVWGRNLRALEETKDKVESTGGSCFVYRVDVTDREAVYSTAGKIKSQFGMVDILVNNAGVAYGKNILDSNDDEIVNTFNVNIISHFYTTKAFLPEMLKINSGHVVTMSSMGGYTAVNRMTDYCASKFAAVGYNEALTMELRVNGHTGVLTTLVCPYYVDTGMFSGIASRWVPRT
ncbi:estradiol 17-beta-dehydrogenase 11 [Hyalella azteca]|uniref:Short-chain dehydrogenase/reductase 3 n=1 Tax=Hyalella azteca TaxID=294128 RepID=A0A8B7N229_HYAAZ|nr:estradiol 17-beta-dehydrogenase 11 [Hyalella azteca]